jgi:hypothetical protein
MWIVSAPNPNQNCVAYRTTVVSFKTEDGRLFCHVTMAHSVFEAVREGMDFFADPFWRGPKPTPEAVFEVSLVGDERVWRVMGRMARPPSMRI